MSKFTLIFTLIGIAICFYHYIGLDINNIAILSFSIPLWFIHAFYDVQDLNIFLVYFLTIGSWVLLGYILDRLVQKSRANRL